MSVPVNKDGHFRVGCEYLFGRFKVGGIRSANSRIHAEHAESYKRPSNVMGKDQEWYGYEYKKANNNSIDGEDDPQNSSGETQRTKDTIVQEYTCPY